MKKLSMLFICLCVANTVLTTGCSSDSANNEKIAQAEEGHVVELEGLQDQYGWFPHIRLTFDNETITEVYFDYVDDAGAKKSQDEEYNSTMKEKTGISVKDAMEALRQNLIAVQDPAQVDIVTGSTQTSTEFITMAKQAYDQYLNGENSENNYGDGDQMTSDDDTTTEEISEGGTEGEGEESQASEETEVYENGGDGSPNSPENAENVESSEGGDSSSGGAAATNE